MSVQPSVLHPFKPYLREEEKLNMNRETGESVEEKKQKDFVSF